MNSKGFLAGLAVAAVVFAGVGFYLVNQASQTGGASAPSYQVAGDPNYAIAVMSTTTSPFTLGNYAQASGTYVLPVTLLRGLSYGLKVGDTCGVQLSSATSSYGYSQDAQITSISKQSSTVSVVFFNGASSTNVTISTGTLTLACQNY